MNLVEMIRKYYKQEINLDIYTDWDGKTIHIKIGGYPPYKQYDNALTFGIKESEDVIVNKLDDMLEES